MSRAKKPKPIVELNSLSPLDARLNVYDGQMLLRDWEIDKKFGGRLITWFGANDEGETRLTIEEARALGKLLIEWANYRPGQPKDSQP